MRKADCISKGIGRGFNPRSVQNWERAKPESTARAYLPVIARDRRWWIGRGKHRR